jgi:hypothetical protein
MRSGIVNHQWGFEDGKKKIHWRSWEWLSSPKLLGVLGFKDFALFNQAMLGKLCWHLVTDATSLCAWVLKGRYNPDSEFLSATKPRALYADFMNGHTNYLHKYLWKLKVSLKIRIVMWFLHRNVILTKDNLVKRNWTGCTKCVFCNSEASVEHLFIRCPFAKLVWQVIGFTFNIPPPTNIKNLFGRWLNGIEKKIKERIRVGVCALIWAIWNCRNDVIFNNAGSDQFLQVINKTSH